MKPRLEMSSPFARSEQILVSGIPVNLGFRGHLSGSPGLPRIETWSWDMEILVP